MSEARERPKFTPGPWSAKDWRVCAGVYGPPNRFKFICDTATNAKSRNEENAANARLIAAAPDLYAACEWALAHCNDEDVANQLRTAIQNAKKG